ncbi:hypothetical protein Pst134EA_028987 [Puccinia striiformis f. sp. tritici]|uniref:C2H2-type domain-containing protein n=1 Tax=Puccinia striiformis f. sp. tritici PST-78 TaxID=1165861 RepID=A0A0L0VDN7_9BASI|nr:hypothetical protein Pst134EA_028987 [Puccinia striiformis f. sp. tritici]KAH9447003.1 hypothetical protein Pst134EA_028987 [Puccinia striiformis f. sp. tritici]KNE97074.1 hypothetical protein PSTG_09648 [Puccinia striiformis f. sp. tritici PST-78]
MMDYLSSQQQPPMDFYPEDTQCQGQFNWNLLATDPLLNVDAPSTLPDYQFDPVFTPEQLATLLQTCDSPYTTDSFSSDFPTDCMNQPEWNLQPFPELNVPSPGNHFVQCPQPPLLVDSATYRDGFGNPIQPMDFHPYDSHVGYEPYSSPVGYETYASLPAMASSGYSPTDSYPRYAYPSSQPPPAMERLNTWDHVASSSYLPSKASTGSDVTSPSVVSEQPVKKHRCQICGRAFQRQTTLTQHQITHTGERPYSCPVAGCGKAFTTASNAKRHAKTHFRISHGFHHVTSPPHGPY